MKTTLILGLSMPLWLMACEANETSPQPISESTYLDVNNTSQFVMICGENRSNPVLLHLHGGSGVSAIGGLRQNNRGRFGVALPWVFRCQSNALTS